MVTFEYTYPVPQKVRDSYPTVGGGDYSGKISQSTLDAADHVVTSVSDLQSAANNATQGDVVRVDTDLDLTGTSRVDFDTKDITICGDRGHDGSEGPILHSTNEGEDLIGLYGDGSTVTGLNFQCADGSHGAFSYDTVASKCILIHAKYCEIYNCRLRGAGEAAIQWGSISSPDYEKLDVHHCEIADCPKDDLSYAVVVEHGHLEVRRCYMDNCRHKIAADGDSDCRYTVRDSWVGEHAVRQALDMHEGPTGDGGLFLDVQYCDIQEQRDPYDTSTNDGLRSGFYIRANPIQTSPIKHNAFGNPNLSHDTWGAAIEITGFSWPGNIDVWDPDGNDTNEYDLADVTSSSKGIRPAGEDDDSGDTTTKPAAPSDLAAEFAGFDDIRLEWVDNADNEDEFYVMESTDGGVTFSRVATLAPDAEQYTRTNLARESTYTHKIVAANEAGTAESGTVSTSFPTLSGGRTGSKGWHIEIFHPSGRVLRPSPSSRVSWQPRLNDLPKIRIPVEQAPHWDREELERAAMRVWYDGVRLPIDELQDVEQSPGETILVGRGGTDLLTVAGRSYTSTTAHAAARDLIQAETPYGTNVDDPAAGEGTTELFVQSADRAEEFDRLSSIPADSPATVDSTRDLAKLHASAAVVEAEDRTRGSGEAVVSDADFSGGSGVELAAAGEYVEFDVSFDYDVPESAATIAFRFETTGGVAFEAYLNGIKVVDDSVGSAAALGWKQMLGDYTGGDLSAGNTQTLRVENADGASAVRVDVVAVYDDRYSYTFDNSVDSNGNLSGPETKPDAHQIGFETVPSSRLVVGARVDSVWNPDVSNQQALAVSKTGGTASYTEPNSETLDTAFDPGGSSLTFMPTLSRTGSRTTATPSTGFKTQFIDKFSLFATVSNTPIITSRRYQGSVLEILQDIAEFGDFIFEVTMNRAGETTIEWTQPGDRPASIDPALVDYSAPKKVSESFQKVFVEGSSQPITGETVVAKHDEAVDLAEQYLVEGREVVRDGAGTTYEPLRDYRMDWQKGTITALPGGTITNGGTVEIDYEARAHGEWTADGYDPGADRATQVDIPAVTTDLGAQSAARHILKRVETPLYSAEVQIASPDPTQSLVESVDVAGLPFSSNLEIQEIDHEPDQVTLRLGSRSPIEEVVSDLQARLQAVSQRV